MPKLPRYWRGILVTATAGMAAAAPAADPAPVRTILQQTDLSAEKPQAAAMGTVALKKGAAIAWHTHAGVEIVYVETGRVEMSVAGKPDVTLTAGQSALVPRGLAHRARAIGGDARLVATWITDAGGPMSEPAAAPR